ncbi:MAG TPA: hypothetical protein VFD92_14690 [Candidatus Binatia bacterium]|nr:hypothetical protein [Candidatus Binatia bacterium]
METHGTAVVAWIASADGQSGPVHAVTVGADGNPRSQVIRLADDARTVSLVPTSDGVLAVFDRVEEGSVALFAVPVALRRGGQ